MLLSRFVPLFQTNKHHAPFLSVWFLWELKPCRRRGTESEPCSHHEALAWRPASCVPPHGSKEEGYGGLLFLFFRTPNISGGGGEGSKSKMKHCHLIWQLECRFDVLGTAWPRCKETLVLQSHQEVTAALEQLIGSKWHVALQLMESCEVTKIKVFLWCKKYSYTAGHNTTVQFVYSYFYSAHFILLSFYWWGCL